MIVIETLTTDAKNLSRVLSELVPKMSGTPVYRALDQKSCAAYRRSGLLIPRDGDYYISGRGVFFYFDPRPICIFDPRPMVVVSSFERLSRDRKTIDTRLRGFDSEAVAILDRERGAGNYTGYDVWLKVLENDTITATLTTSPRYLDGLSIYTRKMPVRADELDFEIVLTDVPLDTSVEGVVYTCGD